MLLNVQKKGGCNIYMVYVDRSQALHPLLVTSTGCPVGGRVLFSSPVSSPYRVHTGVKECDDIMTANCSHWDGVGWIAW